MDTCYAEKPVLVISWLPDPHLREDWPVIKAMLEPAVERGHDLFDPEIDICWLIYEGSTAVAAATTRLRTNGIAELRLAGGTRLREWVGLLDETVTNWARDAGASRLNMRGRRGWARFAARCGWEAVGRDGDKMIFEKVL